MNRRLQNTYTALATSGGVLALAVMMAVPVPPQASAPEPIPLRIGPVEFTYTPDRAGLDRNQRAEALARSIERRAARVDSLADAAALSAEIATAAALAGTLGDVDAAKADDETPRRGNKSRRHSRQTLAMPYFSFAPRG